MKECKELPNLLRYIYPMECPECSAILWVIEEQSTIISVNPIGLPKDIHNIDENYKLIGVCPKCGFKTNLIKIGQYYARDTTYFRNVKADAEKCIKTAKKIDKDLFGKYKGD